MFNKFRSVVLFSKILVTLVLSREFACMVSELEKYVLKRNIIKFIKNQRVLWGSIYKDCLSLLCLAVVMTVFAVAILKSKKSSKAKHIHVHYIL